MIVDQLENGECGQSDPSGEGAPTAELRDAHLSVESVRPDLHLGLCNVLAVGCVARREALVHDAAPDDEPQGDKDCA